MRIRLEKVGHYTCLPVPPRIAETEGFCAGDQVEAIWDQMRSQLLIRAVADDAASEPKIEGDISRSLEEFLRRYADALSELASL